MYKSYNVCPDIALLFSEDEGILHLLEPGGALPTPLTLSVRKLQFPRSCCCYLSEMIWLPGLLQQILG